MRRAGWIAHSIVIMSVAACRGSGGDSSPPPPGTFTVGGIVSGLAGAGLVLRLNGGNDLAVSQNGAFTFAGGLANGAVYTVTVQTQPSGPTQDCVVGSGSGTIANANVVSVTVTCATRSFLIGGTVTGLTGLGLTLRDVAGTQVTVNAGTASFQFPAAVASGGTYFVAIAAQPVANPAQVCTLSDGAGVVGGTNVTSIRVVCNSGAARFVYSPDFVSNNVQALRVDGVTGALAVVTGSPFASVPGPQAIAATPSGAFLYVLSSSAAAVSAFAVDQTSGALTPVAGSPFTVIPGGNTALPALYMDPSGRFLYIQQSGSSFYYGYAIHPASGALIPIPGSPFAAPVGSGWLGFDPFDRYAYTISPGAAGSATFRLDNATGALTPVGTPVFTDGGGSIPTGVVHPSGAFVYASFGAGPIHALRVDLTTGQLTHAGVVSAGAPRFPRIDPNGRFLYVSAGNDVLGYLIAPQTGVLAPSPGSPFAAGPQTENFDIDPTGTYLYAPAVLGQGTLSGFVIDPVTGALATAGNPLPFGQNTNPNVARVDRAGRTVYVSSFGDDRIRNFAINRADGSLTLISNIQVLNVGVTGLLLVGTQ